jgi:hypothetical protein
MTREERRERIESYGRGPALLVEALKEFPRSMWEYKPGPERWSIHEIIVHLADADLSSAIRCRFFIAEPGKVVTPYDQDAWAERLDYHAQNAADALELFKWIRKTTYDLLKLQPDSVFANTIRHPEHGDITLDWWLEIYDDHVKKHIGQMRRNYDTWATSQK